MLLLAVDTSGKCGSIALAQCGGEHCDVLQLVPLVGGTFSAQLVPQIAALLATHGFSKQDIGGFAVATGPGSFTGLRVGLAAIKALATILQQPIAGVSLLEAVASASSVAGSILALMDAGRGEAFAGNYDVGPGGDIRAMGEHLIKLDNLQASETQHLVTPDRSVAEVLGRKEIETELIEHPRTDAIARLGWRKIRAGNTILPEELEANYIRQSDAEIFFRPQGQS
jgi:tRNA threonylcarbamoyladenosine biosynthesis protein TsaB